MSEGIKSLGNEEQDDNLFLSRPEQRGLEAATFGSVLGQAPATGNIFGDLLSVAAQTAPAAVATFKERQSIKEKEAEYKDKTEKKLDLATQFVALTSAPDVPVAVTKQQLYEDTLRPINERLYVKYEKSEESKRLVNVNKKIFNEDGGLVDVVPDIVAYTEYKKHPELYELQQNLDLYYIYDEKKPGDISTQNLTTAAAKAIMEKNPNMVVTTKEPALYIEQITEIKARSKDKATEFNNAKKQYKAAGQVVRLAEELDAVIAERKGGKPVTGNFGDAFIALEGLAGGIGSTFSALFDPNSEKDREIYADALKKLEQAAEEERKKPGGIKKDSMYAFANNAALSTSEKAQKIKSLLTQLVYKIAKSRESGGKFSVPDIQFAFQSAGESSAANVLRTGLSVIVSDVVDDNVRSMRGALREMYPEKYTLRDENQNIIGYNEEAIDRDLFIGGPGVSGLGYYQNVLKSYYKFKKKDLPDDYKSFDQEAIRQQDIEQSVDAYQKGMDDIFNESGN